MDRDFLRDLLGENPSDYQPKISHEHQIEILTDYCMDFRTPITFRIGDIITQRDDYQVYRLPKPGDPAVVLDIIENPQYSKQSKGDAANKENLLIGIIVSNGQIPNFLVEAHRFTHYTHKTTP